MVQFQCATLHQETVGVFYSRSIFFRDHQQCIYTSPERGRQSKTNDCEPNVLAIGKLQVAKLIGDHTPHNMNAPELLSDKCTLVNLVLYNILSSNSHDI